ncbi:Serine/threonine-protein kinase smg1 [Acarospora aff. strigata]|nr:Serine/threonine-protein kinase smg1 [Acarospora aff. strigata]
MPQAQPELKKYLDKRLFVQLNGSRKVIGVLRGYDVYIMTRLIITNGRILTRSW